MGKILFPEEAKKIMTDRFGKDSLISVATVENGIPYNRTVDGYYEDGAFYVITYLLSGKMQQIAKNPTVAISGEWFTAHGEGKSMGWFCEESNKEVAAKLRKAFAEWIDNGHNNFDDKNTVILRIDLTDGILFANGSRFDLDFSCYRE